MPAGLTGCVMCGRGREYRFGSNALPRVIPEMSRPVGEGVSELRIDYGPGYRVYFKYAGREIVILLTGGDKSTQSADIRTALRLARNL